MPDRKKMLAWAIGHIVWLTTTAWVALLLLKALAVSRGDASVAFAILSGGWLGAAISAGSLLLIFGLAVVAGLAHGVVLGAHMGVSPIDRLTFFFVELMAVMLMLFSAPLANTVILVAITLLTTFLALCIRLWRSRKRAAVDQPSKSERDNSTRDALTFLVAGAVLPTLAFAAISPVPWMQSERFSVAGASEPTVGYYVGQDSKWTTLLLHDSRQLQIVETTEVTSRTPCRAAVESPVFNDFWSHPLSAFSSPPLEGCK